MGQHNHYGSWTKGDSAIPMGVEAQKLVIVVAMHTVHSASPSVLSVHQSLATKLSFLPTASSERFQDGHHAVCPELSHDQLVG